jgi:ketosteroid isomerase-like protein
MSLQQNSAAVAAARAHVEAWSKRDYEAARAALADDVWVTVIAADPNFPKTDLKGVDAYMQG